MALEDMQERSDPDSLSIERVGDTYEVNGVLDLGMEDADLEGNPFEEQITEAFDTAELRIAITFPGEVLETNGRVQGTTVTWRPVFGERTEITAVASAVPDSAGGDDASEGTEAAGSTESSGGDALRYAILGLIVLAVAVGVYVIVRRRGPSEAPRVPPPPAEPPSEGPIA